MAKVLIIDDDRLMNETLASLVERLGHEVACIFTLKGGLALASAGDFDVVFLDVRLPDGSGLKALPEIRRSRSEPEVIIITGYSEPKGAELAIKSGAWDYIRKPASLNTMTLPLLRALQYREERRKAKLSPVLLKREGIIGQSFKLTTALERVAQAAGSDANVLIVGESGTGKELFARAIQINSPRASKPFVVVDCAAMPENLVESLLFGHEKGAFTGADRSKEGLIAQADKGTLFLDEVGELPRAIQKAFLRVLQERRFRPVGAKQEQESDFRVIAATNRNLEKMVQEHQFREDLLFRLRAFIIELPPLRERLEDLKELVAHYLIRLNKPYGKGIKAVSPEFLDILTAYGWPGNVRELVQTLEQVVAVAGREAVLFPYHLPQDMRIKVTQASLTPETCSPRREGEPGPQGLPTLKDFRHQTEQEYLTRLLACACGSRKEACRLSGLSRTHLFDLLRKHNLSTSS